MNIRIIAQLITMLIPISCSTSRKVNDTNKSAYDSIFDSASRVETVFKALDTTKIKFSKAIITEIEFFDVRNCTIPKVDLPEVTINGKFNGKGIKKIKQTAIEKDVIHNGTSKEHKVCESTKEQATVRQKKESKASSREKKRPMIWKWAILASVLAVIVSTLCHKVPILDWLKKYLSAIRKNIQ